MAPANGQHPIDDAVVTNIFAVIVTYQADLGRLNCLLDTLCKQVAGTVVVDNGSDPNLRAMLRRRKLAHEKLMVLGQNRGIAAAQNAGISYAKAHGASSVILFDQDSLPAPDMVARLSAAFTELTARGIAVAAVGPRPSDARLERRSPVYLGGAFFSKVDHLIASGSLIPLSMFDQVGPLREDLFIDYVDVEWCLRAQKMGFACYRLNNVSMEHEFGAPVIIMGRAFVSHNPMRHYYLFRNSIWLWRQNWIPWRWRLSHMPRLILRLGFNALFARPHFEQWRMMARGLADGLTGKLGRGHD